jgi:aryl sulfotransferase
LPNCLLLHFSELKADLPGSIRRIAAFLDVTIDEARFPAIVQHCSFAWMKANATRTVPLGGALWDGGAQTFVHRGTNGRWADSLTAEDNRRYERMARDQLGEACATWLATGNLATATALPRAA